MFAWIFYILPHYIFFVNDGCKRMGPKLTQAECFASFMSKVHFIQKIHINPLFMWWFSISFCVRPHSEPPRKNKEPVKPGSIPAIIGVKYHL